MKPLKTKPAQGNAAPVEKPMVAAPRRIRSYFALAACALYLPGCTQVEMVSLAFTNNGTEARLAKPGPLVLPFEDKDGWIILKASVNGKAPVNFVLDSGASAIALIDSPASKHLGLDMTGVHRLGAEGDLAAPVIARQDGLEIDFGGVALEDQTALAIPEKTLQCTGGEPLDIPFAGVIGYDIFRRFTVEVNYDRKTVTLHDPETYRYRGKGTVMKAEISGRQPFVTTLVSTPGQKPYAARLHVDSGAALDLSLFPGTRPEVQAPAQGRIREACFVGGRATYRIGPHVKLGIGKGGVETGVEYALGKEVIDGDQNGRIGAKFLRRFNVVFDYERERMILEPRKGTVLVS